MASFDVVSRVDLMELDNALNVARKEVETRYDFRGTNTAIERTPEGIVVRTADPEHAKSTLQVIRERMAKRNVPQRCLDPGDVEAAGGQTVRQLIKVKQGIATEDAKKMVKALKDEKLKVQAQIQGDELRVTAKSKDELQLAIRFLRGRDWNIDVQFVNFRD